MTWEVEFTSADFLPYLPEDCQANPGAYGYELAHWLSRELAKRGIVTSYPIGEDWCWLIEHAAGDVETTIGCGSMTDAGEGYLGKPVRWRIFVQPAGSAGGWFGRRGSPPDTSALEAAITAVLTDAGYAPRLSE
jgi:hypothetical protein